ncbi:MAG: ANTAR domain-containing protein [Hyphomicrobiales bacterium]
MISTNASILIAGETVHTLTLIELGLREAGHDNLTVTMGLVGLAAIIEQIQPQAIIIEIGASAHSVQDGVLQLCRALSLPMVVFVDSSTEALTQSAIEAGVAAYIIDGLKKERVKPILEMAMSRFEERSRMLCELENARTELGDRKVIDRAKGFLMQSKGISEEQAYGLMRKTAMDQNRKVRDIANNLILAADLLK